MKIKTAISYNLDLLCFMNVITGREFFMEFHKNSFEKFYPVISDVTNGRIKRVLRLGFPHIGTPVLLPVSSVDDFNNRDLLGMLDDKKGLKNSMKSKASAYYKAIHFFLIRRLIERVITPLAKELESAGFKEFWQANRLPLIQEKCHEVDKYMERYNPYELISRFINFDDSDFTIYLCSFAIPLGVKLSGNNMIADIAHSNDTVLEILTHEVFHPPYDTKKVKKSVKLLARKAWVKEAYKIQKPNFGYRPIVGFVEENIVEALGIYVANQLGLDIDPKEYFSEHDGGSHVISPYFYDYLCENIKDASLSFDDYFTQFVDALRV